MKGQVHKAYKVMLKLIHPKYLSKDQGIPMRILQNAKGIAFVTQLRAGFVWSGTVGSGIVIARLPDGSWSGPSSLGVGGLGWGLQVGGSLTDSVIILNNSLAVKAFSGRGQIKFGGNLSIAAGPIGRDADAGINAGDGGIAACYSYSHSRGVFAGLALQGAILFARDSDNAKFYGQKCSPTAILTGAVPPPQNEDLRQLYNTLRVVTHSKTADFEYRDSRTGSFHQEVSADDGQDDVPHNASYFEDDTESLGPSATSSNHTNSYGLDYPTATPASGSSSAWGGTTAKTSYDPPTSGGWNDHSTGTPTTAYEPPYQQHSGVPAPAPSSSGLPLGWQEVKTADGQVYYWNETTNETQWERPQHAASQHVPLPPSPPQPTPHSYGVNKPANTYEDSFGHSSYTSSIPEASPVQAESSWYNQQQNSSSPYMQQPSAQQREQYHEQPGAASNLANELSSRLTMRETVQTSSSGSSYQPPLPQRTPSASSPSYAAPMSTIATASHSPSAPHYTSSPEPAPAPAPAPAQTTAAPSPMYTMDEVVNRSVPDMDPRRLEEYLRDDEFQKVFGMPRASFNSQPKWKRDNMKKSKNLF